MARIPLADIPNAPGPGPDPTLGPNLPGVKLARPVDRSGGLKDTGARGRAQALLGDADQQTRRGVQVHVAALEGTKREQINPSAFAGEGEGISRIGEAISQSGAVAAQFAQHMFAAKDAVDMARVDTIMRNTLEQHQADMDSGKLPESQWVEGYKAKIPDMQKQIEDLNISPRVRAKVDADMIRFNSSASISIARAATNRSLEIGKNTILNAASKAYADGDFDVGEAHLQEGVTTGLLRQDEADAGILKFETAKRGEWVAQAMNSDPPGFLAKMEEARKTGKPPEEFHWLQPTDIDRNYRAAKSLVGQIQSEKLNGIAQSIDTGDLIDPKEIEAAAKSRGPGDADLDLKQIRALKHSLLEVNGPNPEAVSKAITMVETYDSANDKDRTKFNDTMHFLLTELPRNYSSDLRTRLYQRRMGYDKSGTAVTVPEKVSGMISTKVDELFSAGQFGEFQKRTKAGTAIGPADETAKSAAWSKAVLIKDAFRNYKPKDPSSLSEAYDWLKSQMRTENLGIGADKLKEEVKPGILSRAAGFIWKEFALNGGDDEDPPEKPDLKSQDLNALETKYSK